MKVTWSPVKNAELQQRYGFGFERVAITIREGLSLDVRDHPNEERYGHQKQFVVEIDGYAWLVPFVFDDETIFLKTMFPSRVATKEYLGG